MQQNYLKRRPRSKLTQFTSGSQFNWVKWKLISLSHFSLVGGFFEGTRENILHIFRALMFTVVSLHALSLYFVCTYLQCVHRFSLRWASLEVRRLYFSVLCFFLHSSKTLFFWIKSRQFEINMLHQRPSRL